MTPLGWAGTVRFGANALVGSLSIDARWKLLRLWPSNTRVD